MNNNDMEELFNTLFGNAFKDSKELITNDYVNGKISKEEFIRRMDEYKQQNRNLR